jgi:predicted TIM-barrel fold metal-dependent hydrolase
LFLGCLTGACLAETATVPIIDTHIHLFDPTRPQGVPWPGKDDSILYQPALPGRFRKVVSGLGIRGAIEVECSPWLDDNQWVLDVAAKDTFIVGTVGNLVPGATDFRKHLERFHRNPLFRGIRYGNLWGRNLGAELSKPAFVSGLKALGEAGLVLDTANPNPELLADIVRLSDLVANLRIVVDHLPRLTPPVERAARHAYQLTLSELGKRPQVYVKVSQVLRRVDGGVPEKPGFYRETLDELWDLFGENRLLFGSDWPNSDPWGPYALVLKIVRGYFAGKGPAATQKFFWKNSATAYRWIKREAGQPDPRSV